MAEFDGLRAKLYNEALERYPLARQQDIAVMFEHLDPQPGDKILGFGEGNGYFCLPIAEAVGWEGRYLVTDPSKDQLDNLRKKIDLPQVEVQQFGIEGIDVPDGSFDKVWSFGAFHHCPNQTDAMRNIYRALRTGGQLVLVDVFQGSSLAKHFDSFVARYCETGHEVKFLSHDFARSLCDLTEFSDTRLLNLPIQWKFKHRQSLGDFIYRLHAMTKIPGNEAERIRMTEESCSKILGVDFDGNMYRLNWPLTAIIATK